MMHRDVLEGDGWVMDSGLQNGRTCSSAFFPPAAVRLPTGFEQLEEVLRFFEAAVSHRRR